jgi:hypothetical protein
VLSIVRSTKQ